MEWTEQHKGPWTRRYGERVRSTKTVTVRGTPDLPNWRLSRQQRRHQARLLKKHPVAA